MDSAPGWVEQVRDCDRRADSLRRALVPLADERARVITDAVAAYGRSGRELAAAELGVTVGQVDVAIRRARNRPEPTGLPWPGELLERLYRLELAELEPLPRRLWQHLIHVLSDTFIDISWIEEPGQLIADEVEDTTDDEPTNEAVAQLAARAKSWNRMQALAVLDAINRRDLDAIPTSADSVEIGDEEKHSVNGV